MVLFMFKPKGRRMEELRGIDLRWGGGLGLNCFSFNYAYFNPYSKVDFKLYRFLDLQSWIGQIRS